MRIINTRKKGRYAIIINNCNTANNHTPHMIIRQHDQAATVNSQEIFNTALQSDDHSAVNMFSCFHSSNFEMVF